jgi:hypothetical protein
MALPIIGHAASTGSLRETYDRPAHGGAAGVIQADSLDPLAR